MQWAYPAKAFQVWWEWKKFPASQEWRDRKKASMQVG